VSSTRMNPARQTNAGALPVEQHARSEANAGRSWCRIARRKYRPLPRSQSRSLGALADNRHIYSQVTAGTEAASEQLLHPGVDPRVNLSAA